MRISGTVSSVLSTKGRHVFTIPSETTVFEAIQLMADKNVGALLVMGEGRLLGLVSERDYTRKVALKGRSSRETTVREIVSAPIIAASPDHSVEECMRLMTTHRIRHLPVLDGDHIAGVVSIGDLVNWTISAQDAAIEQMENYIAGR